MNAQTHPYFGATIAYATKHGKEKLIAAALHDALNAQVQVANVDTDTLGTFSGEIERTLSPLEAAVTKARMGMDALGLDYGIASEGSIGPDPLVHFLLSDIETMVFLDRTREITIVETHRSFDITAATLAADPTTPLDDFLREADFPRHHLIVRENTKGKITHVVKGIDSLARLTRAIEEISALSPDGKVIIESDLRAHASPSRQKNITTLSEKLLARILSLCSSCGAPGWGKLSYEKGLTCLECGTDVPNAIHREILSCVACERAERGKIIATEVDPAHCPQCNP